MSKLKYLIVPLLFLLAQHAIGQLTKRLEKIRNGDSIWVLRSPTVWENFHFYIGDKKVDKEEWIMQISQHGEEVAALVQSANHLRKRCLRVGYAGLGLIMVGIAPLGAYHADYRNSGSGPVVPAIILGSVGMAGAVLARSYALRSDKQYREAVRLYNEPLRSSQSGVHLGLGVTQHGLGLVLSW